MNRIIEILMERDSLSYDDAKEIFDEAKVEADSIWEDTENDVVTNMITLENIMEDYFGLEPDYIFDLVDL